MDPSDVKTAGKGKWPSLFIMQDKPEREVGASTWKALRGFLAVSSVTGSQPWEDGCHSCVLKASGAGAEGRPRAEIRS